MVIGLIGVQFSLLSYEWLTKSDDREAGVRFVNDEYEIQTELLTIKECADALNNFHKTPGFDSFKIEIYRSFWEVIGHIIGR